MTIDEASTEVVDAVVTITMIKASKEAAATVEVMAIAVVNMEASKAVMAGVREVATAVNHHVIINNVERKVASVARKDMAMSHLDITVVRTKVAMAEVSKATVMNHLVITAVKMKVVTVEVKVAMEDKAAAVVVVMADKAVVVVMEDKAAVVVMVDKAAVVVTEEAAAAVMVVMDDKAVATEAALLASIRMKSCNTTNNMAILKMPASSARLCRSLAITKATSSPRIWTKPDFNKVISSSTSKVVAVNNMMPTVWVQALR